MARTRSRRKAVMIVVSDTVTMSHEDVALDDVSEFPHNSKEHPDKQIALIAASIEQFGFRDPIAIDEEGVILEGHGRVLAARSLNMKRVPAFRLSGLTDREKMLYNVAHNKLTLETGNNPEKVAEALRGVFTDTADNGIDLDVLGFDPIEYEIEEDLQTPAAQQAADRTRSRTQAERPKETGTYDLVYEDPDDIRIVQTFLKGLVTDGNKDRTPAQRVIEHLHREGDAVIRKMKDAR